MISVIRPIITATDSILCTPTFQAVTPERSGLPTRNSEEAVAELCRSPVPSPWPAHPECGDSGSFSKDRFTIFGFPSENFIQSSSPMVDLLPLMLRIMLSYVFYSVILTIFSVIIKCKSYYLPKRK